jgi:hypothetical protein
MLLCPAVCSCASSGRGSRVGAPGVVVASGSWPSIFKDLKQGSGPPIPSGPFRNLAVGPFDGWERNDSIKITVQLVPGHFTVFCETLNGIPSQGNVSGCARLGLPCKRRLDWISWLSSRSISNVARLHKLTPVSPRDERALEGVGYRRQVRPGS